jgi:uncharacterized protein YdeI (YjbR/CyaY-like superfamily)
MLIHKGLEVLEFSDYSALNDWLGNNHKRKLGIWLRVYKVNSLTPSVTREEFVKLGLTWGWIDGLTNSYDEQSYLIRYTPRGIKSIWSKINVNIVEQLIKEGLMQPSGLEHVNNAKKDGRWERAYEPPSKMTIENDFFLELEKYPDAKIAFSKLNKTELYSIGFGISTVKVENKQKKIISIINKLNSKK